MAIFNETTIGGVNAKDCTADASKILDGYTAAVGKEIVEGTMPDNGNVDSAIADGILKAGYTSGGQIENLVAENLKKGITIGGIIGNYSGESILIDAGSYSYDTRITVDNPFGTNLNGAILIGTKYNSSTIIMLTIIKQSDGNYSAYRLYYNTYSAPTGYTVRDKTLSEISVSDIQISVTTNSITFYYVRGSSSVYFRGQYYCLIW